MRRAATLLAIAAFVGCSAAPPMAAGRDIELFEFGVAVSTTWSPGAAATVTNAGERPHTLVVADEQGTVLQASDIIAPGTTVDLPFNLPPGEYELTCRLVIENGAGELVDHFEEGMVAEIVVVE